MKGSQNKEEKKMGRQASSGSDGDGQYEMVAVDDRKKRRMISNRESARRSRMRKQQHLETLVGQINQLQAEKGQLMQSVNDTSQMFMEVESENNVLRAQAMELTDRLQYLNSVLHTFEDSSGFAMDVSEIPDSVLEQWQNSLMEPWQLPYSGQPIMASPDVFQC